MLFRSINESIQINGSINIGAGFIFDNDINVNGNIGMEGRFIYMGKKNQFGQYGKLVCNTENKYFMGVNQPVDTQKIIPGSTFEVYCDNSGGGMTAFNAYCSTLYPTQSVLISNYNYQGTATYMDVCSNSMYFFSENRMPTDTQTNDITGLTYTSPFLLNTYSNGINYNPNNQNSAKPNGEITYQLGGNMLLRVDNRTFISSKTILGKRGVFNTYYVDSSLNEKMIIYVDPSYNKSYIYPYYEKDGNYTTNNALDRKSTRLNSSHTDISRMPSSA